MYWFAHVDIYCERTHDGVWSEPLNFFTNAAFIASALILFFKVGKLSSTRLLCLLLAGIGVASGLFHFFGQIWSLIADILSINLFVLFYLFFSNRHYLGASPLWAALGAAMFLPYVAATVPIFQMIPMIEGSSAYLSIVLLILFYSLLLRSRLPVVSRGLATGFGILLFSIFFRTVDVHWCDQFPAGTHFLWHILNAIMLGWMIYVYSRHRSMQDKLKEKTVF